MTTLADIELFSDPAERGKVSALTVNEAPWGDSPKPMPAVRMQRRRLDKTAWAIPSCTNQTATSQPVFSALRSRTECAPAGQAT
jgi:hypothetical protein